MNPRWSLQDLSVEHPQALEDILAQLELLLAGFEASRLRLSPSLPVNEFLDLLHTLEIIRGMAARVGGYAYLFFAENTQNPTALSLQGRIDQILTGIENRALFFTLWFKDLPDEPAHRYIAAAGDLSYFLESLRRFKPYTLSEPEEKIINLKDVNGVQGLAKIYEILTNNFSYNLEVDGEIKKLTRDGLTRFYHHPSAEIRAATYTELYRVYGENKTVLSQIYAYLVRDLKSEAVELRSYASPISIRNLSNNIPDAVVNTLLEVCRQNTGLFRRYFQLKARMLGMDRLRRYDVYAPVTHSEKAIEFNEAVSLILASFGQFSPQFAQAATQVMGQAHLDAEVRPGKRSGAFCYSVTPELLPWVMVNFTGRIRDTTTLAHELGHAVHTVLASDHSILTFHPPQPLAETASIFAEMLVTDRLLQQETDPALKRDLLMTILDDAYATIQRQAFISIFEKEAHARIATGCTQDDLAEVYRQNLVEQFGDSLELTDEFAWEWLTIPHIFSSPFYTYAYCFGQLLVLALYQQYLAGRDAFVPRYLKLLSYGGSAEPQAILAEAGLDISSPEFWQGGFHVLQNKLDQLEQITGGS